MGVPQVRAALVSVSAGVAILLFKFGAYLLTGSMAILSDAAESVVNVVAANVALLSLIVAARPPDAAHQYGHGKAEYLSGATEGAMIILAGGWVLVTAVLRLLSPLPLRHLDWGLAVLAAATTANYLTARFLLKVSRVVESAALEADARHLLADVLTSIGVFVGLGLSWFFRQPRVDAAVAVAVSLHVLRMGGTVFLQAVGGLMDTSLPPGEEAAVRRILDEHRGEIVEYHALRARKVGPRRFLDLHLVLHRVLRVGEAHALCDDLERHVEEALPATDITIHVEPCERPCPVCDRPDLSPPDPGRPDPGRLGPDRPPPTAESSRILPA
ncbi:MAG: cation diffusion facilitator family transporter [Armatimonadota bacterium]|nr:cation diffusion facilitator family transporter [Armatimonadota bacterium]MDR7452713.1 cation diffusion facilitator family transporter [Armatimonadota bacterium]MDR7465730.1 cation diffusion facilitator family transporter [Armatimonadota bacterium]MDR7493638.1 cation diffusion facilitator family transporter [Armatimonadota bacterium]MDR7499113.1 cation diffusion facilitator family transporter [Armatimonadota bacterium]